MDIASLVRGFYSDLWSPFDMEPVKLLMSESVTWKTAFSGAEATGHDAFFTHMGALKAAFPDLQCELTELDVTDATASATVRWTGTHQGHIWRTEGTGRALDVSTEVAATAADGRLTRIVESLDWAVVRAQLEAAPPEIIELEPQKVIPILRTEDWEKARRFYSGILGFRVLFEHRYGCDFPVFAGLERDGVQVQITEHTGDAQVGASIVIHVSDVDEAA